MKPIRIEASENIFDARSMLSFQQIPKVPESTKILEPVEAEATLLRLINWRDHQNVFAPGGLSVAWLNKYVTQPKRGPENVAQWNKYWGIENANSVEGQIKFQGGDLLAKLAATPDELTPDDFRLHADSAGYRAGKDGKDLGADIDFVGPGEAYERWKKTPEYQQWRKDIAEKK